MKMVQKVLKVWGEIINYEIPSWMAGEQMYVEKYDGITRTH